MQNNIDKIINLALEEDISSGDITGTAIFNEEHTSKGVFLIKQEGILAGLDIVEKVFNTLDPNLKYKKYSQDGQSVFPGDVIAEVTGSTKSILSGERTALNFLQRMCGIATISNQFYELVKHTNVTLLDTRKTAPGLRLLDKMAVKAGGFENHRIGLYDMFLIKDNHIAAAGSITSAVNACREYMSKKDKIYRIEVEVTNLIELGEALELNVDVIMLDNFKVTDLLKAVKITNRRTKLEASGRINFETIKNVAETGVDYISIGAVTHSIKALDISLEVTPVLK